MANVNSVKWPLDGAEVRERIRGKGWNQERVARNIGVDYTLFSRYLSGQRPCPATVIGVLAFVLECDVTDITPDSCTNCQQPVTKRQGAGPRDARPGRGPASTGALEDAA